MVLVDLSAFIVATKMMNLISFVNFPIYKIFRASHIIVYADFPSSDNQQYEV